MQIVTFYFGYVVESDPFTQSKMEAIGPESKRIRKEDIRLKKEIVITGIFSLAEEIAESCADMKTPCVEKASGAETALQTDAVPNGNFVV